MIALTTLSYGGVNDSFLINLSFFLIFVYKLPMRWLISVYFLIILNAKVAPFDIVNLHLLSEMNRK